MPIVEYEEIIPCGEGTPTVNLNTTEWLESTIFRSGTDLKPLMEAHSGDPGELATDNENALWIDQPGYQAGYIAAYGDTVPPRAPGVITMRVRGRQNFGWTQEPDRDSLATSAIAVVQAPAGADVVTRIRRLNSSTSLPVHILATSNTVGTGAFERIEVNFTAGGSTDSAEWLDALLNGHYRIDVAVDKDGGADQAPYEVGFLGLRVVWTVDEPDEEEPPPPPDPEEEPVQAKEFGGTRRQFLRRL